MVLNALVSVVKGILMRLFHDDERALKNAFYRISGTFWGVNGVYLKDNLYFCVNGKLIADQWR